MVYLKACKSNNKSCNHTIVVHLRVVVLFLQYTGGGGGGNCDAREVKKSFPGDKVRGIPHVNRNDGKVIV